MGILTRGARHRSKLAKSTGPLRVNFRRLIIRLLTIALIAFVSKWIWDTGELRILGNVNADRCVRLAANRRGFEDIARFSDGSLLSFSSDHHHFKFELGKSMREMIATKSTDVAAYVIAPASSTPSPVTLKGLPSEFFPHGIHGRGAPSQGSTASTAIAVNHKSNVDAIEVFDLASSTDEGWTLTHKKSISHSLLFNINDCALTPAADAFYCTNWRSQKTGTFRDMAEVYLRMPWTNVVRCEVTLGSCKEVASGLKMANGIQISDDGRFVFVVESLRPSITVFTVENGGMLTLSHRIRTRESCDNLEWDGNDLLSGCHPRALTWVRYTKDVEKRQSPCTVLRIVNAAKKRDHFTRVDFQDAVGNVVSGCSAAAIKGDFLFIGAVHDRGLVRCRRVAVDEKENGEVGDSEREL